MHLKSNAMINACHVGPWAVSMVRIFQVEDLTSSALGMHTHLCYHCEGVGGIERQLPCRPFLLLTLRTLLFSEAGFLRSEHLILGSENVNGLEKNLNCPRD